MQDVALFNLGPIFKLLLLAAVVAMGPLVWVWLRHRHQDVPQRVHQLTALTLFLCFDLVLFGSFTRLSDSGLGCANRHAHRACDFKQSVDRNDPPLFRHDLGRADTHLGGVFVET